MSSLRPKRARDDDGLADGLPDAQSRPSKRNFTSSMATPHSQHHSRRKSEGSLLDSFGGLRLDIPPIETLPQELLLQIFENLVHPSLVTAGFPEQRAIHRRDDCHLRDDEPDEYGLVGAVKRRNLRNVCLVSRKFKMAATTLLYRCAHLATAKSPTCFLLALTAHPDLQPLVTHVSVPTYVGYISKRFSFAFVHNTENCIVPWARPRELQGSFSAECEQFIGGGLLRLMIPLVPNLRTLIIPQTNLVDGPYTKDLVLRDLTTLRITLMAQNESISREYGTPCIVRTTTWLTPSFIGQRFPALQRLEVSTPNGRWEANLVSEKVDAAQGGSPLKYVESLKTTTTSSVAPVDWDIMSLNRPIFHPSKLHTLKFAGPGLQCGLTFAFAATSNLDVNRFLAEKGSGLRILSLDWELHESGVDDPPNHQNQEVYFGAERRLTTLDKLTKLTHLTVSLQALFGEAETFSDWVEEMKDSPDTELAKLLPQSLRTLRIAEYIPGVYEEDSEDPVDEWDEHTDIRYHSRCVYSFLQALRAWWLTRDKSRELWLRRYDDLDQLEKDSGASLGRSTLASILDDTAERDGRFERVLGPPEDTEAAERPDGGPTETQDQGPDGSPDQESDEEKVWVYQDGKLVLV